jgi:hypothetical protein
VSRHLITLYSPADRARAVRYIAAAPDGTRVELKAAKRTLDQNAKFWAMLTEVAVQKVHADRKYPPHVWKALFIHGLGREAQLVPSLDNGTLVNLGHSSSDLSKEEMSQLIEFIYAWGAQNGVQFNDPIGAAA